MTTADEPSAPPDWADIYTAHAVRDDVAGPAADVERRLVVAAALGSLSGSQLAIVYLHYWEDMTLLQVADHLGVRIGTVSTQLDRAKKRLRVALASTSEEGERT